MAARNAYQIHSNRFVVTAVEVKTILIVLVYAIYIYS